MPSSSVPSSPAVTVAHPVGVPASVPASERTPDLPGCEPIPLPASALDTFDARLEVWDGRTCCFVTLPWWCAPSPPGGGAWTRTTP